MTEEGTKLNWGILATGHIAGAFAEGVQHSRSGRLAAVASRSQESADRFADQFGGIANRHPSYDLLLEDPDVEAVYIATPHPMHKEWAIRAAQAGKHILCEKPIGMDLDEAEQIIAAARENDVFLMEAYMYRCSAQTAEIVRLISEGAIGEVKSIEASFSFDIGPNPDGRHLNKALGGGGILDVGGYPMSMAMLVAGVACGKGYAEPDAIKAVGHLGETGVDEYTSAVALFPGGITARLSCGVALEEPINVSIAGTEGRIFVPLPWKPAQKGGATQLQLFRPGNDDPEVIEVVSGDHLYGAEADTVARYLDARQACSPAMGWDETLGLMRALDAWKAEIGLSYGE
ncbi:MAG: Gfo/Idh/MocA family oxidoreductase [Verrucomicrobiales bacterium]|nr:Gfo/Idh/MocA family oxidoreductase [Verrucomicrobiales bacterium]